MIAVGHPTSRSSDGQRPHPSVGGEFESLGHGDNLLSKPQFVTAFSIEICLGFDIEPLAAQ